MHRIWGFRAMLLSLYGSFPYHCKTLIITFWTWVSSKDNPLLLPQMPHFNDFFAGLASSLSIGPIPIIAVPINHLDPKTWEVELRFNSIDKCISVSILQYVLFSTVPTLCALLQWQTIQVRWPAPANELPALPLPWPRPFLSLWYPGWWPTKWALSGRRRRLQRLHAQHHGYSL